MAQDLALVFEFQQGGHGVFDGGGLVLPMGLIEVDVVGPQPGEAPVEFRGDGVGAEVAEDLHGERRRGECLFHRRG